MSWTIRCDDEYTIMAVRVAASQPSWAFVVQEASRCGTRFILMALYHEFAITQLHAERFAMYQVVNMFGCTGADMQGSVSPLLALRC